jgi:hypothetical protein
VTLAESRWPHTRSSSRPATIFLVAAAKEGLIRVACPTGAVFVAAGSRRIPIFKVVQSPPPSAFHRLGHQFLSAISDLVNALCRSQKARLESSGRSIKGMGAKDLMSLNALPPVLPACPKLERILTRLKSPHSALIRPPRQLFANGIPADLSECVGASDEIGTDRGDPGILARPPRTNKSASVR